MASVQTLPTEFITLPSATQRAYNGLYRALRRCLQSDPRFAHKLRTIGMPRHATALQARARCYLDLNISELEYMIKKMGELRSNLRQLLSRGVALEKSRKSVIGEVTQLADRLRAWSTEAQAVVEAEARARHLVLDGFVIKTTRRERARHFQAWQRQLQYFSNLQTRMSFIYQWYEQLVDRMDEINMLSADVRESTKDTKGKIEVQMEKIREEEKRVNQRAKLLGLEKLEWKLDEFLGSRSLDTDQARKQRSL